MDTKRRFVIGAWALIMLALFLLHWLRADNDRLEQHAGKLAVDKSQLEQEVEIREAELAGHHYRASKEVSKSVGTVTAYTCDSSMDAKQKAMNCPNGITASGTIPKHKQTAACDRSNLGRRFHIEGIGEVTCEDTGGAIKGPGRFDIFVDTYAEAIAFGKQQISYQQLTLSN